MTPRRRASDRLDVRLPRSLVVSIVVSILVLVVVGLVGIVVTNNRSATAAERLSDAARCLLLQSLEERAYSYAADQAAADFHGYDYDDHLPARTRPPDLKAVLVELEGACDRLVPRDLIDVPRVAPSTTVPAAAGPAGPSGPAGRDGSSGRPGQPGRPGGSPSSTTSTTTRRPLLPTLPTLPISANEDLADDYAAGMSIAAAFAGAGLIMLVVFAGLARAYRLRASLGRHPAGRTLDP